MIHVDEKNLIIYAPDGAHSPYGPSGSKKWINCSGSINAGKGRPNKSSSYANEGTAAHGLSEVCRIENVKASRYKGWTVRVSRGKEGDANFETSDHLVDQVMIDSVQEFIDWCNDVPAERILIEETLPYEEYVPGGFGTLDDGRLSDDLCVLTDFKHGTGVQVWAEKNEQLLFQALSVYLKYRAWFSFKHFVLRIAQPRLGHFDVWGIDKDGNYTLTLEYLLEWAKNTARPAYLRTLQPNASRAAGDWCQFCTAKGDCNTRAAKMLADVTRECDFTSIEAAAEAVEPVADATMLPHELDACLRVVDDVMAWCKDVKKHAMAEMQSGTYKGTWKLVEGRSKRIYIVPESELEEELVEGFGLTEQQLYKKKFITPAQLEKIIGKKHEIMLTCVRKPPGKPKLAPPDDKRPAMEPAVLAQFANLDEEEKDDDD